MNFFGGEIVWNIHGWVNYSNRPVAYGAQF